MKVNMQEPYLNAPTEALEVLAKEGDVILRLGVRRFLVWSGVLKLASPVFAAMFDGRLLEGQSLSAVSPPGVALPDDDAAAMCLLCKNMHLQTGDISTSMGYADLGTLALVADKYDCTHLLQPWRMTWFPALVTINQFNDLEKPLLAAYIFDTPNEFFKISQSMIRDCSEPLNIMAALEQDVLPIHVVDQILKKQHNAQKQALAAFNEVVTGNELCNSALQIVGSCFKKFVDDGLWPFGIPSVLHLKTNVDSAGVAIAQGCNNSSCVCQKGFACKDEIIATITAVYDSATGLCLACAKLRELGHAQPCRVSHTYI
jgi:hypothetical protein